MRPTDRTNLAIILSLVALTLFDAMGLIIKHLSDSYSAAELSAWRNLFGLIPSIIALWSSKAWHAGEKRLKIRQWKLGLLRGVVVTFAQLCFYMSLGLMLFPQRLPSLMQAHCSPLHLQFRCLANVLVGSDGVLFRSALQVSLWLFNRAETAFRYMRFCRS